MLINLITRCRLDSAFYETLKTRWYESQDEFVENGGGGAITSANTNGLSVTMKDGMTLEQFSKLLADVVHHVEAGTMPAKVTVGRFLN